MIIKRRKGVRSMQDDNMNENWDQNIGEDRQNQGEMDPTTEKGRKGGKTRIDRDINEDTPDTGEAIDEQDRGGFGDDTEQI